MDANDTAKCHLIGIYKLDLCYLNRKPWVTIALDAVIWVSPITP